MDIRVYIPIIGIFFAKARDPIFADRDWIKYQEKCFFIFIAFIFLLCL